MAHVTYDGSAMDNITIPQKLKIGSDGKPMNRHVVEPCRLVKEPIDTYPLWGMLFPKNTTVEVKDSNAIKKILALNLFDVVLFPSDALYQDKKWREDYGRYHPRCMFSDAEPAEGKAAPASQEPPKEPESDGLDALKRTSLVTIANSLGISVTPKMKIGDVRRAIRRARQEPAAAEPAQDPGDEWAGDMPDSAFE